MGPATPSARSVGQPSPVFGALSSHSPPGGAPCVCRSTLSVFGVSLQDHWGNRSWPTPGNVDEGWSSHNIPFIFKDLNPRILLSEVCVDFGPLVD